MCSYSGCFTNLTYLNLIEIYFHVKLYKVAKQPLLMLNEMVVTPSLVNNLLKPAQNIIAIFVVAAEEQSTET